MIDMRRLFVGALIAVLFNGCGRAPESAPGARRAWTTPHVLRIGELAEPDTLNPYLSQLDVTYDLTSLVYSYLVIADDRGRLIGDLATDVPTRADGGISPDGLTYTYHLRRGVRWHDGAAFTAPDVVASWKAVMDPSHLTIYRQGYDQVSSIQAPDPYTVVIHLRRRYPPFVTQFFAPLQEGGKPVLPAHILERDRDFNHGTLATHPIGTGPFVFVEWRRGQEIELRRNDRYFRGKPALSKVVMRFIPDAQTLLTQVRTHQLDLVDEVPSALYPSFKSIPDYITGLSPWNAQMLVVFNGRRSGLRDPSVRRAIADAFDANEVIEKIAHGVGTPARDIIAPTALGYVSRQPYGYDPSEADALLDRAGWKRGRDGVRTKDGYRLSYAIAIVGGVSTATEFAEYLQERLRTVGIELTIKPYPWTQIFSFDGPIDTYRYDLALMGTTLSWDPDSHVYFGCNEQFPKGQNFYDYCNRRYDELERAGFSTDDPRKRAALYEQADAQLWNTVAYIPLYEMRRASVRNPDLKNYAPNTTSTPWWNAWTWDI
jgi:peptide/nickel transport system substrate-binding protein